MRRVSDDGVVIAAMLAIAAPILAHPLAWLLPAWNTFRSPLHLPVGCLAGVMTLGAFALQNYLMRSSSPLQGVGAFGDRTLLGVSCGWLLTLLISAAGSTHPIWSAAELPHWVAMGALFWLGASGGQIHLRRLAAAWWCVGLAVAINGLLRVGMEPELVSTVGNRNVLAAYLAATVFVGLGWWGQVCHDSEMDAGHRRNRLSILGLVLGVVAMLAAMAGCGSRGAWLALVVGAIAWLWLGAPAMRRVAMGAALALLLMGVWARTEVAKWWQTDVRPPIWRSTLSMVRAQPWTGHGLGVFVAAYPEYRHGSYWQRPKATNVTDHAHNEWLQIAAEQGIPAAVVWGGIWLVGLWRTYRRARHEQVWRGLWAAMIVLAVHGMVDIGLRSFTLQPVVWLGLGLLCAPTGAPPRAQVVPWGTGRFAKPVGYGMIAVAAWLLWFGVWQPLRADWWDRQARVAFARGDVAAAAEWAGRTLEIQPWRLEMRYWLAGVLAESGTHLGLHAAIDQCEELRRWAPNYAEVVPNLARLYELAGQPERAAALRSEARSVSAPEHRK